MKYKPIRIKQKLPFLLFVAIFLYTVNAVAQNYSYVPNEMIKAVKKGTRTGTGVPGTNYWQNHAVYDIRAVLHADSSMLEGTETITWFNESPDTIKTLVIRLYQDFYKKGAGRSWNIGPDDITGGVRVTEFTVNGREATLPEKSGRFYLGTNKTVHLSPPLNPGDSAVLFFKWRFHIPEKIRNRMGNYGHGRFFIAYWYPQVAVYDDISGWDRINFDGITEFYNDFNNYKVSITVPAGYAVWATGRLQNGQEVYQPEILRRIAKARKSDKVIRLITQNDWKRGKVLKNTGPAVWKFTARNVTDFSFAAMPRYNWDASSVMVDSSSRRRVFVDAVYSADTKTFDKAAEYARKSIVFMSYHWPGVPYPYEHMTSVSNGTPYGGMETPMMANDGDPQSKESCAGLVFHEISHSYFPFFMGTNEKKYAWMDEGWAAYLTGLFSDVETPRINYFDRTAATFQSVNGNENEVPLMYPSNLINDFRYYRIHAYTRPALAYKYLRDALGDSLFKSALHEYIRRWHGKHPVPFDFFNTFNNVTGEDLSWFFNPWFFDKAVADLSVKKVTGDRKIIVENKGGLPLPVKVTCIYSDGTNDTFYKPVSVWRTGAKAVVFQADTEKTIMTVVVGENDIPDINRKNNRFELEP